MGTESSSEYPLRLGARLPFIGGWLTRKEIRNLAANGSPAALEKLALAAVHPSNARLKKLALAALRELALNNNPEAIETACQLVIYHYLPSMRDQLVAAKLAPKDDCDRAIFYFLTKQWAKYESLDFDHRLLRSAYENGNNQLRKRLGSVARAEGRVEWADVVSGGRRWLRLGSMTSGEWHGAIKVLESNNRWEEIWLLSQQAPPKWGAILLKLLDNAKWIPAGGDKADFHQLRILARHWQEIDFECLLHDKSILRGHTDEIRCLAFSPDGRHVVTGSCDDSVRIWKIKEFTATAVLTGHGGAVQCLAISPNGRLLASGGKNRSVLLWKLPSGKPIKRLEGHTQRVSSVAITPDNRTLASGGADGAIQLWSLPHGKSLGLLPGHDGPVYSLAAAPDGKTLISVGADNQVRLWSMPRCRLIKALHGHRNHEGDAILCLAVSPDGALVASGSSDNTLRVWRVADGREFLTLEAPQGQICSTVFSPDGQFLVSGGGDNAISYWEIPEGRQVQCFEAHSAAVTRVIVHPNGRMVASTSGNGLGCDHSIRLWSLPGGRHLQSLYGHSRYINCMSFSSDGRYLATAGGDGAVHLWTSELSRLAELPIRQATLHDLELIDQALISNHYSEPEKHALNFIAALIRRSRRHDIVIDELTTIHAGELDIEIEG